MTTADPRTRRSRTDLEAALRQLIAERDLGRISVSDLTKLAGVNRSTFYEHYKDVDELAIAACTAVFDELVAASPATVRYPPPENQPDANPLTTLFAHVKEYAPLYRALLTEDGSARMINHVHERMATAVHSALTDDPPGTGHDPVSAFGAGAVLGAVLDWLRHGCPGRPEGIAEALLPSALAFAKASGMQVTDSAPGR